MVSSLRYALRGIVVVGGGALLFLVLALWHPLAASAATITVTSNGDTIAIDGLATLREAITSINNQADVNGDVTLNRVGAYGINDMINFSIPVAGVQTINVVGSALPPISKTVTINGYTQVGATANTLANGDNAVILIELNGAGTGAGTDGLDLNVSGCVVQGLAINRFPNNEIGIGIGITNTTVTGNFIGTNATGTAALGNGNIGVVSSGPTNTIGGTSPAARNIISGNSQGVVLTSVNATGNLVEGNFIGTNAAGTAAIANTLAGVNIGNGATGNTIGGTAAGARNVISGNFVGIAIQNSGTMGNVVEGNFIGIEPTGTAALANTNLGVVVDNSAANTTIGGTAAGTGNLIAFNGIGVQVGNTAADTTAVGNAILGNSIHDNGAPTGLDLAGDGVTANGANPRAFPNHGQNYPVLTAAFGTTIAGMLDSAASTTFRIEFFSTPSGAVGGRNGETFLGFTSVTTNGVGQATFVFTTASALTVGQVITATATNTTVGDSSEFSAPLTVTAPSGGGGTPNCATLTASPNPVPFGGGATDLAWDTCDGSNAEVTVANNGGPEVDFVASGAPSGHRLTTNPDGQGFIVSGSYIFRLYRAGSHTLLAGVIVQKANPKGTTGPAIVAAPSGVPFEAGVVLHQVTIKFDTGDDTPGDVYVSLNNGAQTLFTENVTSPGGSGAPGAAKASARTAGAQPADASPNGEVAKWVQSGTYTFTLRSKATGQVLDTATVTTGGGLAATPNPVAGGSNVTGTSTQLTFNTGSGLPGAVCVANASNVYVPNTTSNSGAGISSLNGLTTGSYTAVLYVSASGQPITAVVPGIGGCTANVPLVPAPGIAPVTITVAP